MLGLGRLGGLGVAQEVFGAVGVEVQLQELLVDGPLGSARKGKAGAPRCLSRRHITQPAGYVAAQRPKGGVGGILGKKPLGPAHCEAGHGGVRRVLFEKASRVGYFGALGDSRVGPNALGGRERLVPASGPRGPAQKLPAGIDHVGKAGENVAVGHVGLFFAAKLGQRLGVEQRHLNI